MSGKRSIVLFFSALLVWCVSCNNETHKNDFDVVCQVFEEMQSTEDVSPLERGKISLKKIRARLGADSVARVWWETVINAQQDQRYAIYKDGAEDALGRPWDCAAMKELAPVTGG